MAQTKSTGHQLQLEATHDLALSPQESIRGVHLLPSSAQLLLVVTNHRLCLLTLTGQLLRERTLESYRGKIVDFTQVCCIGALASPSSSSSSGSVASAGSAHLFVHDHRFGADLADQFHLLSVTPEHDLRWERTWSHFVEQPEQRGDTLTMASDGRVLCVLTQHHLFRYDANTGRLRRTHRIKQASVLFHSKPICAAVSGERLLYMQEEDSSSRWLLHSVPIDKLPDATPFLTVASSPTLIPFKPAAFEVGSDVGQVFTPALAIDAARHRLLIGDGRNRRLLSCSIDKGKVEECWSLPGDQPTPTESVRDAWGVEQKMMFAVGGDFVVVAEDGAVQSFRIVPAALLVAYTQMTITELKAACKGKGLARTGLKANLRERLEAAGGANKDCASILAGAAATAITDALASSVPAPLTPPVRSIHPSPLDAMLAATAPAPAVSPAGASMATEALDTVADVSPFWTVISNHFSPDTQLPMAPSSSSKPIHSADVGAASDELADWLVVEEDDT